MFVFGHSSGAALALEATARGLAITKLALYEPPFIVDDSRPPLPKDYVTQLTELVSAGRRGDAVEFFLTKAVGLPVDVVAEMRNAPMWQAMEDLAHTLAYDGTIMGDTMSGNPLPTEWAASVTVPTLVMDGEKSDAWQRNAVQALADILPMRSTAPWKVRTTAQRRRSSLPCWRSSSPPETALGREPRRDDDRRIGACECRRSARPPSSCASVDAGSATGAASDRTARPKMERTPGRAPSETTQGPLAKQQPQ